MAGIGQTGKAAFRLCTAVHELNHLCGHKEEFPRGKSTGKPEQKKQEAPSLTRSFCTVCRRGSIFSLPRRPVLRYDFPALAGVRGILEMDAPLSPIHFCV